MTPFRLRAEQLLDLDLHKKNHGLATSGVLPAIGTGIRYSVIQKRKMNAGVDVAFGKMIGEFISE
jgi:hypothetical protein